MKKLSIPERISLERVLLPGIGWRELPPLLFTVVPALAVTVLLWFLLEEPGKKLLALVCGMAAAFVFYAVVAKVDGMQSVYAYIAKILRFWRSQRKYFYKQGEETLFYVEKR